MMNRYFKVMILVFALVKSGIGYAQQTGNRKISHTLFLAQMLRTDTVKAGEVVVIQRAYNIAAQGIAVDASLSGPAKAARIKQLEVDKNNKLKALLTPRQFDQITPVNERAESAPIAHLKDSLDKQKYTLYLQKKLSVDQYKARQVAGIQQEFQKNLHLLSKDGKQDKGTRSKIDQLMAEKNNSLSLILTPAQMDMIVPERVKAKPGTIDTARANEKTLIWKEFAQQAKAVLKDTTLSKQVKDARVKELAQEKDKKLLNIGSKEASRPNPNAGKKAAY